MHRVIFDGSHLRYLQTGLGQFCHQLLKCYQTLPLADFEVEALVHPRGAADVPATKLLNTWVRRYGGPARHFLFPASDLWHVTAEHRFHTPVRTRHVLLTLHGLHFLNEAFSDAQKRKNLEAVQRLVDRSDAVATVSRHTLHFAQQHLNLSGKRPQVIHIGFNPTSAEPVNPGLVRGPFLFFVGSFFERKNVHVLLPLVRQYPQLSLVLAGNHNTAYGERVKSMIQEQRLDQQVILPGEISENAKVWLYQHCEAFVFPSLDEGFGIPILEALWYGKPVFTSNRASLPEVAGPFAHYWHSFEDDHIISVFEKGRQEIEEPDYGRRQKAKQYAAQFTWSNTAQHYVNLYRQLMAQS